MKIGASTFIWVSPFSNSTLDLIDHVKEIGFDLIEICIEDPATIDSKTIRGRLQQADLGALVCGAFGPSRDISSEDGAVREAGLAYIARCVDIAATLGSDLVSGPMYAATGKTRLLPPQARAAQWRLAVENMQQACDHAAGRGVRLAVEPLNRFETDLINTVAQAVAFISEVGRPNAGLLLDTFHMNIEEKNLPEAIRHAGSRLFHFHACGNDRGTPGEDHLPWPAIAAALRDIDYRGAAVIESFTPEIKEIARAVSIWRKLAPDQDTLASNGLSFLRRVLV